MHNPQDGNDHIRQYQEDDCNFDWPDEYLGDRYTLEEEAYRDLGPHQGGKCLDPFAVGVFMDLDKMPLGEIVLWSPEAVVDLHVNQSIAYDIANLDKISTSPGWELCERRDWFYKCQ